MDSISSKTSIFGDAKRLMVYIPGKPSQTWNSSYNNYEDITASDYNLNSIPIHKIRVVDRNDMNIHYGNYDSSCGSVLFIIYNKKRTEPNHTKAIKRMNRSHNKPGRYINKKYKFTSGAGITSISNQDHVKFYFLKNPISPKYKSNPITLYKINRITNEKEHIKDFPSLSDLCCHFGTTARSSNWRSVYINTGKPYKKIWFLKISSL